MRDDRMPSPQPYVLTQPFAERPHHHLYGAVACRYPFDMLARQESCICPEGMAGLRLPDDCACRTCYRARNWADAMPDTLPVVLNAGCPASDPTLPRPP